MKTGGALLKVVEVTLLCYVALVSLCYSPAAIAGEGSAVHSTAVIQNERFGLLNTPGSNTAFDESILMAAKKESKASNMSEGPGATAAPKSLEIKKTESRGPQLYVELVNTSDSPRSITIDFYDTVLVDTNKKEYKVIFNDISSDDAFLQFCRMSGIQRPKEPAAQNTNAASEGKPVWIRTVTYNLKSYYRSEGSKIKDDTAKLTSHDAIEKAMRSNLVYYHCDSERECGFKYLHPGLRESRIYKEAPPMIFKRYGWAFNELDCLKGESFRGMKQAYVFEAKEPGVFSGDQSPLVVTQTSAMKWEILMNGKGSITLILPFNAPDEMQPYELRWPGMKAVRL